MTSQMYFAIFFLVTCFTLKVHAETTTEYPTPECGRFLNYKYFLGNRTEFDDYPWLALLEYETPRGNLASCGGVLLNQRYILTAGHCVSNLGSNWTLSTVRLGEYDTNSTIDCLSEGDAENTTICLPEPLTFKIEKVIVHEKYGRKSRGHDLALVKLTEDVKYTEFIQPICLPKKEPIPQKFHVSGWGKLAGRRGYNLKLRSFVSLVNGSECKEWYRNQNVIMAEDQFCAGGKDKEQACFADSGGPLMGVEKNDDGSFKMTVFGVFTMDSRFCDYKGWPGIFIDVPTYKSWIVENMKL